MCGWKRAMQRCNSSSAKTIELRNKDEIAKVLLQSHFIQINKIISLFWRRKNLKTDPNLASQFDDFKTN